MSTCVLSLISLFTKYSVTVTLDRFYYYILNLHNTKFTNRKITTEKKTCNCRVKEK